ncbi:Uncharacterised protein [uncultured Eubacterium sp.]|nr:Uncharacterised protein [uncultured Eubacterium sp.]
MTTKKEKKGQAASVYTVSQLAAASDKLFGTSKIIVKAALKTSEKKTFTEDEAVKIVNAFRKKEVK